LKKQNQWTHGELDLELSELPQEQVGCVGCTLLRATFDNAIGKEVYALYSEDPLYCQQYASVKPFNLFIHPGLAETPHGLVGFIVWQIAAGSPQEVLMEHYLNPYLTKTIDLIASAANQTHLKLIVADNQTAETGAFVEFENKFPFDEFAGAMALATRHEREGDFALAAQHVMNTMSVNDLLALSAKLRISLGGP
jgi:hypothetical protein